MTKTKNRHDDAYEVIGATVRAEAIRLDAEHKCWMTVDLDEGQVVTFVWFGTTTKMKKLQRQLDTLPKVDLLFKSQHANSDKIIAALRTSVKRGTRQKTLKKLQRSAR